jgi:hypothetical protein
MVIDVLKYSMDDWNNRRFAIIGLLWENKLIISLKTLVLTVILLNTRNKAVFITGPVPEIELPKGNIKLNSACKVEEFLPAPMCEEKNMNYVLSRDEIPERNAFSQRTSIWHAGIC